MQKYGFVIGLCLLCSCTTVLNGKKTHVNIHAPENTKVTYNDEDFLVKNGNTTIFPLRSKDSLRFEISNDSIANEFSFSKRTSGKYFFNFFLPYSYGLGYIVDLTNPKRFTYKRNLYFEIDSINNQFICPLNEPIHFKKKDLFVYTTPLKIIDVFSQPMFTIGGEYFFLDQMSVSAEYGTVFTNRLGGTRNTRFKLVKNKGRAFRYELKFYNLLSISSNPRVNEYIGFETRFLRYQFNEDISFSRQLDDIRYRVDETLVVHKSVDIFNIKYGLNYPIGKHFFIDLYSGFGIRRTKLKNPNRNFDPETDVLNNYDCYFFDFRRNHVEGINETNEFNFTLGFKFGYKF